MGGLNKQGEEKNRVPDTAHDCPILRIGVLQEQPVLERENLSKWELFYFFLFPFLNFVSDIATQIVHGTKNFTVV